MTTLNDLNVLMAEMWSEINAPRNKDGQPIRFSLAPDEHSYLYYRGEKGEMFCYTPHPDTHGDYWCWTYKPKGTGSRSGKATKWHMTDLVRCSKRKTAKAKALKRLHNQEAKCQ